MTPRNRRLLVTETVRLHAEHRATRSAVIDGQGATTYRGLWEAATAYAAFLTSRGLRRGDLVAVAMEAAAPQVAVMLGVLAAGGVMAPLNTRLTAVELGEYLARLDARWHVVAPAFADLVPVGAAGRIDLPGDAVPAAPDGSSPDVALCDRLGIAPAGGDPEPGDEAAPAFAFPTGGTTGTPKAALWTHRSLFLAVSSSCTHLDVRPDDVELYVSPFFHVTLVPGLLATLTLGGTVIIPRAFDPVTAARALTGGVTRMFGTPTVVDRLLHHVPDGAGDDVEATIIFGAARSDDSFIARLRQAFPRARLFSGYGATEFGAVVRLYPADVVAGGRGVGRPVAGVRVRIVDPDGHDLPAGVAGEIAVASPWQMEGYLGGPEMTHGQLSDGAIRSGDIGRFDADGFLHLDGRLADTIRTGGETVFPAEIERVLLSHPAVSDAAAFGIEDAEWGQRVEAVVVLATGAGGEEQELRAFCRRQLAGFKVPKRIRAVDALPYTANMKLDRRRLPDLVSDRP